MPYALLDLDRSGNHVDVLPLQTEHLRNAGTGRDAGLNHQQVGLFQASQHASGFLESQDPALSFVALLTQLGLAHRTPLSLFPEAVAFGVGVEPIHDGPDAVPRPPRIERRME